MGFTYEGKTHSTLMTVGVMGCLIRPQSEDEYYD